MRILVSNDDGYFAPGITLLAEALRQLGEVTVVAPERDRSGASNSLTLDRPLTVRRAPNGYFSVNGTPTDCVHIAVTGLLDFTPDLIVSGVNLGANMGDDTIYSGTVAAAAEGYLLGIPSVAVSLTSKTGEHFETAIGVALEIVGRLRARAVRRAGAAQRQRARRRSRRRCAASRSRAWASATRPSRWSSCRPRAARPRSGSARPAARRTPARAPTSTRSRRSRVSVTPLRMDLTHHEPARDRAGNGCSVEKHRRASA